MPAEEIERHKLKVLFVSHTFPPADRPLANVGGMQRVAVDLHGALAHHPEVAVRDVVLRSSWRWIYMRTPPYLLRAYRAIENAARSGAVDVVLFSSMIPATLAAPLRSLLNESGVATLAIAHGQDVTWPFAPYQHVLQSAFEALDGVVAVSRATGEQCLARGLPPPGFTSFPTVSARTASAALSLRVSATSSAAGSCCAPLALLRTATPSCSAASAGRSSARASAGSSTP